MRDCHQFDPKATNSSHYKKNLYSQMSPPPPPFPPYEKSKKKRMKDTKMQIQQCAYKMTDKADDPNARVILRQLGWLQRNAEEYSSKISTRQKLSQLPPLSLQLCNTTIPISESAKNLGVHLDSTLSMQNFVSQTAKSCYYHLRRISLIRKHLTTEATVKLVLCLIMSRIDYCNSLLSGVNQSYIHTLQRIQNNAARLILKKKKTDHISPLLTQLRTLAPVNMIRGIICQNPGTGVKEVV